MLWSVFIVITMDCGGFSLTDKAFFVDYLPIFVASYLDFIFSLALIFSQVFKALIRIWLGFWILRKIKNKGLIKRTAVNTELLRAI